MNIKRILILSLALILVLAMATACATPQTDESTNPEGTKAELNIFTWDGYFPQEVLDAFEEQMPDGVTVNFSAFTTNEEMLTKLSAAKGGDYDIILASDYIINLAIKENLVSKIDKTLVPNFSNLNEAFQGQYYDEADEYTIPYAPGTPLIVYDPDMTDLKIEGYADLWDESLKGNIVLLDNYRVISGITLLTMGESMNTTDIAKIEEAGQKLIDLAPNVRAIDGSNPQAMLNGEVIAGFIFSSQVVEALQINPSLEVVYPKEGMGFGIDAIFIPENAPNKETAHAFINYILDAKVGAQISESILYMCPNKASEEFLSEEFKSNKALHIPSEVLGNTEFIVDVDLEATETYNKIWAEFIQATN